MAAAQWVFPPPTTSPTFFDTSLLTTNLEVFLNASTSEWPSSGFGYTPTFNHDAIRLEWPSSSTPPLTVAWHCLPCRQLSSSITESANWEACAYPAPDTLPDLITADIPVYDQGDNTYMWTLNAESPLPQDTRTRSLMCVLGVPSANAPYSITRPFRFTNADRQRVTGESFYVFNASAPEGGAFDMPYDETPYHERWAWTIGATAGLAFTMVALFIGVLGGMLYLMNRRREKQKKGATGSATTLTTTQGNSDLDAAESGMVGGVGKGDKSERRVEGQGDEGLPRYEGPPGYAEATSPAGSTHDVEAVGVAK